MTLLKTPEVKVLEELMEVEDTTDRVVTYTIQTESEDFIFTFVYGNLISFSRCKR